MSDLLPYPQCFCAVIFGATEQEDLYAIWDQERRQYLSQWEYSVADAWREACEILAL